MNRPLRRPDYYKESEKWENPFQVMLVRSWEDYKKHAKGMQRVEEDNNKDRNITISVLTRS